MYTFCAALWRFRMYTSHCNVHAYPKKRFLFCYLKFNLIFSSTGLHVEQDHGARLRLYWYNGQCNINILHLHVVMYA